MIVMNYCSYEQFYLLKTSYSLHVSCLSVHCMLVIGMHKKFEILIQIVHTTAFFILYYDLTFMISCKYVRIPLRRNWYNHVIFSGIWVPSHLYLMIINRFLVDLCYVYYSLICRNIRLKLHRTCLIDKVTFHQFS